MRQSVDRVAFARPPVFGRVRGGGMRRERRQFAIEAHGL
jgi:hypothetical protein